MIPPLVSGADTPLVHVAINRSWLPFVIGCCLDTLKNPRVWEGTDAEIAATLNDVDDLIKRLMTPYSEIGTMTWHILADLPDYLHPCDGSILLRVDYPEYYDAALPDFQIDADHVLVPDARDKFIKVASPVGGIGDTGGDSTSELLAANHAPHTHGANTGLPGTHYFLGQSTGGDQDPQTVVVVSAAGTETRISPFAATASQGSGAAFNNEPQFIIIGLAMRVK